VTGRQDWECASLLAPWEEVHAKAKRQGTAAVRDAGARDRGARGFLVPTRADSRAGVTTALLGPSAAVPSRSRMTRALWPYAAQICSRKRALRRGTSVSICVHLGLC
jgi:hypothetical protein